MNHRLAARSPQTRVGLAGLAGLLGLAGAVVLSCREPEPDRRAEVLTGIVEGQLLVDLDAAKAAGEALEGEVRALCEDLDAAQLDAAQAAWMDLRGPWKRLLAVALGPLADDGYEAAIDFWPVRPTSVEGGIAAGITSQAELDALGVASKGMPALELLLWDPLADDTAVLAALEADPARCAYAELLAADVVLRLTELDAAWREEFAVELLAADSAAIPNLAVALDLVVNAMIAGLHDIDDMKLGKPLGLASGIGPDPELVESRYSDRSLLDARDGLEGFARAYLGTDEDHPGISVLVASKSASIDAEVRAAIDAARDALAGVPEPLREAIVDDPEAVDAAEAAVEHLRLLLTTDVAGLLGVTVTLSDNDGD